MKKILLLIILLISSSVLFAGTLQKEGTGFFDSSTTNNFNMGSSEKKEEVKDSAGMNESLYNLDLYGLDLILPHQPANEQLIATITGFGLTYKYSEHVSMWGRYSKFTVDGVQLEGVSTSWDHVHYAGGFGYRSNIGSKNRIVFNGGITKAEIKETAKFGSIGGLQTGAVIDMKYFWVSDNLSYGPYITLSNVPSSASTWEEHHKGGYTTIGATLQFGIPSMNQ